MLKQRVRVVVVENEKLQSELRKSRMAEESLEHCTAVTFDLCLYRTVTLL